MTLDRWLIITLLTVAGCAPDDGDDDSNPDTVIRTDGEAADLAVLDDGLADRGADAGEDMAPEPDGAVDLAVEPDLSLDMAIEPDMTIDMAVDMAIEPDMVIEDRNFSFFVTSLQAMRTLSGSEDGFGGDLGGLDGADAICQTIAHGVGMGHKQWRAFLSATQGPDGQPVHAIERIGEGPWYDANGRLIANDIAGLLQSRPAGDPQTINDLPDEFGVPLTVLGDSHDILTGSNRQGRLNNPAPASTCNDWTSASGQVGRNTVMLGHAWPRSNRMGREWIADHPARGCAPGVNLIQNGPGVGDCVGCGGGYGGIYCFALSP